MQPLWLSSLAIAAHIKKGNPHGQRYLQADAPIHVNWMIDKWNKKNGGRIHVTGASVNGEA
jgi:hypothetical protein